MPELPEVETVRRGLEPVLVGNRFETVEQRRADLRFPLPQRFAERLEGRTVEALDRRAKYLLARLDDGEVLGHIDTSGGSTIVEAGHLDDPELTIEVPYDVAHSIFIGRDPQAALRAFMEGKIRVTGDVTKVLALQPPTDTDEAIEVAREVAHRIDEITESDSGVT